jgi:hypothetical protein
LNSPCEFESCPAIERANLLRQISAKLRDNVKPLARTIVEEQGKTLGLAEVEVNFTADYIDYMAEWARRIEGEIIPSDRAGETIFCFANRLAWSAASCPAISPSCLSPAKWLRPRLRKCHRDQIQRGNTEQRLRVLPLKKLLPSSPKSSPPRCPPPAAETL